MFPDSHFRLAGLLFGVWWTFMCAGGLPITAQQHRGSPNALAADVVFLKDKTTFYGIIQSASEDELTLVVERQWLQDNHEEFFRNHTARESESAKKAQNHLIQRIDDWMTERPDEVNLILFLEDEKNAAVERIAKADLSDKRFTFLTFAASDIRRVVAQTSKQRQIALVAWQKNLPDVVTRTATDLKTALEKQNVEINDVSIDFTNDVPGIPQSDKEWAIRKNVIEFVFRDSLEFQGTGDSFFRKGEQPGFATLISQMMGQGGSGGIQKIGEELGIPEFTRRTDRQKNRSEKEWWKKQAKIAEKEGFRSFSITRLNQNLFSPEVIVDVFFIGKNEDNQWHMIRKFRGTANADRQSDDDVRVLMDDPQVKKVIQVAESLGLDAAGEQIKKALRHGVATQKAMQLGLNQFAEFTNQLSRRLDAPAIPVEK